MKLTIRLDDDLSSKLNDVFKNHHKKFKTKNDFYIYILESYVKSNTPSIANFLPEIVKSICQESINHNIEENRMLVKEVVRTTELACAKISNVADSLIDYVPQEVDFEET